MSKALPLFLLFLLAVIGIKYYIDVHVQVETSTTEDDPPTPPNPIGPITPIMPPNPIPPYYDLGIYWYSNCTGEAFSIDWGTLYPGGTESTSLYMRNKGNMDLRLALSTSNWVYHQNETQLSTEQYRNYFSLSWDYNNTTIKPTQILNVTLTLEISPLIQNVTSFAFDIIIYW